VSWLETLLPEMLRNIPAPQFSPTLIFDFDHVRAAVAMVEDVIERNRVETFDTAAASAHAAAQDPTHDWITHPVMAPMAAAMWNAEMTFPLILRRSIMIAICSHVEHILRRWCELLHDEWSLPHDLDAFPKKPKWESDVHSLPSVSSRRSKAHAGRLRAMD
jgi:hypothetical protein